LPKRGIPRFERSLIEGLRSAPSLARTHVSPVKPDRHFQDFRIVIDRQVDQSVFAVQIRPQMRFLVRWNFTLLLHSSNAICLVYLLPQRPIMAQRNKWFDGS
jgi:hypothetical protein